MGSRRVLGATLAGAVAFALLRACGYPQPALHGNGDGGVGDGRDIDSAPGAPFVQQFSYDLDVLFVVDNSASTSDKQMAFLAAWSHFATALDGAPQGRPSLHLGVVDSTVDIANTSFPPGCPSPDPNDDGLLQNTSRVPGCAVPNGHFISDLKAPNGTRMTNYAGTLQDAFSCIAQIGSTGCGFEHQLEGMKRALDGSRTENAGFIRDGAALAIVFLTDEDDCSDGDPTLYALGSAAAGPGDFRCQPLYAYSCDQTISASAGGTYTGCKVRTGSYLKDPASYVQFLRTLKKGQPIFVGMVDGDAVKGGNGSYTIMTGMLSAPFNQPLALEPSCSTTINGNLNIGRPGIRLASFTEGFGTRGVQYSACQSDFSAALDDLGRRAVGLLQPCVGEAIDASDRDPANPGVQPACTVMFTNGATTMPLPLCQMQDATTPVSGQPACAWFAVDATCGTPTNLGVHATVSFLTPGTSLAITCAR